eukprot:TRINITY_DN1125_c0_g1_i8.p2 TRINITY_DN1125_c0_g1~~TRINITY_DN1125_c0_g1_i8.p2  ORF type:complete len:116 (+),score=8.82 TRINITY_DN1125_c0_g1_i8:80-427(+)
MTEDPRLVFFACFATNTHNHYEKKKENQKEKRKENAESVASSFCRVNQKGVEQPQTGAHQKTEKKDIEEDKARREQLKIPSSLAFLNKVKSLPLFFFCVFFFVLLHFRVPCRKKE